MLILFFILLVGGGIFTAWRLLAPEMYVRVSSPRRPMYFSWGRPHLRGDSAVPTQMKRMSTVDSLPIAIDEPMLMDEVVPVKDKFKKMELLLLEKNKTISRLQKSIEAERSHRLQFDKIRVVMNEEIERLKTQLKTLKEKEKSRA
jgi:hypothetical protein